MSKLLGTVCAALTLATAGVSFSFAQQILHQPTDSAADHPGESVYWTASGPLYVDQQLDAQSRLIFPHNDQERHQWLSDRISEQLDRQQGNSQFIRNR